ncbi:MAG TPA: hypothetical protein VGA13_07205 [Acidimicrobiales bacterium]
MTDDENPLGPLARSEAPAPDPGFVDRVEQRLRAVHATGAGAETAEALRRVPGRRPRFALAGAVLAAIVVIGVVAGANPFTDDAVELRLASAAGAVVQRADGSEEPAVAGLVLREGDVVTTGAGGQVLIDGIEIGPSRSAVVIGGRIWIIERSGASVSPDDLVDGALDRLLGPVPTEATPTTRPTTDDGRPADEPTDSRSTTTTSNDRPSPSTTPPSGDTTSIRSAATVTDDGTVVVAWEEWSGDGFDRYLVLRAPGDQAPSLGHDSTRVVAEVDERDRSGVFDQPEPGTWTYRVVVVDGDGRAVAASAPLTIDVGRDSGDDPKR